MRLREKDRKRESLTAEYGKNLRLCVKRNPGQRKHPVKDKNPVKGVTRDKKQVKGRSVKTYDQRQKEIAEKKGKKKAVQKQARTSSSKHTHKGKK